jgi:uncharacterized protein (DUF983 family)
MGNSGNSSSSSSAGIGFFGLLGVAFIILKLCHVINWSWWWVTAPLWGGLAIAVVLSVVVALLSVFSKD